MHVFTQTFGKKILMSDRKVTYCVFLTGEIKLCIWLQSYIYILSRKYQERNSTLLEFVMNSRKNRNYICPITTKSFNRYVFCRTIVLVPFLEFFIQETIVSWQWFLIYLIWLSKIWSFFLLPLVCKICQFLMKTFQTGTFYTLWGSICLPTVQVKT